MVLLLLGLGCCCSGIRNNENPITHTWRTREKFQVICPDDRNVYHTGARHHGLGSGSQGVGVHIRFVVEDQEVVSNRGAWGPHTLDGMISRTHQGRRSHDFFDKHVASAACAIVVANSFSTFCQ